VLPPVDFGLPIHVAIVIQRHQPPHQVVDQPEPHNIGCFVLIERLRQVQVEMERLTW